MSFLNTSEVTSLFALGWITILLIITFVLFYFNRLMGYGITRLANIYFWNQLNVCINIESFRFSLLAGRLFVKNFSIVTKDFTVCILEGTFTWQYWLYSLRKPSYSVQTEDEMAKNSKLPSRLLLSLEGVEIFIYNRCYAYTWVAECLEKHSSSSSPVVIEKETSEGLRNRLKRNKRKSNSRNAEFCTENSSLEKDMSSSNSNSEIDGSSTLWYLLRSLPIDVQLHKCGIVLGNENTTSIMVASIERGSGLLDVNKSTCSELDLYKQEFSFEFRCVKVKLKDNVSYKEPVSSAFLNNNDFNIHEEYVRQRRIRRHDRYKKIWGQFMKVFLRSSRSPQDGRKIWNYRDNSEWRGLPAYLDSSDESIVKQEVNEEYAVYRTIIDAEKINLLYYYDVPGKVKQDYMTKPPEKGADVGNGGVPPKTGMNLQLEAATVYYGPWADRQRISFYKYFFPQSNNFRDETPTKKLMPGDTRIYTYFDTHISFVDDKSIVRVPLREHSKDLSNAREKQRDGTEDESSTNLNGNAVNKKPFGWVELKFEKASSADLTVEYERSDSGSNVNGLIYLKKPELGSSVNHDVFFRSSDFQLNLNINFPLKWSGKIAWDTECSSSSSELFLLREHIALLTDMATDFTSVEESLSKNECEIINNYNLFRPYEYAVSLQLTQNFKLYLNVNCQNIINNPLAFDDNNFLIFETDTLLADLTLPVSDIYEKYTKIDYSLKSETLVMSFNAPAWSTLGTFLKDPELANGTDFNCTGSYTYYNSIELDLVDTIIINCVLSNTTFKAYGFLVKSIMVIRENYFGENIAFQTSEEYAAKPKYFADELESIKLEEVHSERKKENELDVLFSFCVNNGCLVLPCNMYDCDTFIAARLPNFDIDIRFTNYYMDLQSDITPLKLSYFEDQPDALKDVVYNTELNVDPDMFINGITIHGHRIFGLPPLEPTYICKWDISTGDIAVNSDGKFVRSLLGTVSNLKYTFTDLENNLAIPDPELNDVTIFTFKCPSISVTLKDESKKYGLVLTLQPLSARLSDLANNRYTFRLDLRIKTAELKVTDFENSKDLLYCSTSIYITDFCRKRGFARHKNLQQEHVRKHDAKFHRAPFFLDDDKRDALYTKSYSRNMISLSLPEIPAPINRQTVDIVFSKLPLGESMEENSFFKDSDSFESADMYDYESDINDEHNWSDEEFLLDFLPTKKFGSSKPSNSKNVFGEDQYFFVHNEDDFSKFTPNFNMNDSKIEYDNFVINVAQIDVYLCPDAVKGILSIGESFLFYKPETILDTLQVDILDDLISMDKALSSMINVRFLTPGIFIHFGNFSNDTRKLDHDFDFAKLFDKDHLCFGVDSIFFAASLKSESESDESIFAFHCGNVFAKLDHYNSDSSISEVVKVDVKDPEFWFNGHEWSVGSVNLDNILVNIESSEISWMSDYIERQTDFFAPLVTKIERVSSKNSDNVVQLLYSLSVASEKFNVHHDPSVLTKPSYIVGNASTKHIRTYDSWRILIRLRHILSSLPPNWEQEIEAHNVHGNHKEAYDTILSIFSKWRSWEFFNIKDNHIFKTVFRNFLEISETSDIKDQNALNLIVNKLKLKMRGISVDLDSFEIEYFSQAENKLALNLTRWESRIDSDIVDIAQENASWVKNKFLSTNAESGNSADIEDSQSIFSLIPEVMRDISLVLNVYHLEHAVRCNDLEIFFEIEKLFTSTVLKNIDSFDINSVLSISKVNFGLNYARELCCSSVYKEFSVNFANTGLLEGFSIAEVVLESAHFDASRKSNFYISVLERFHQNEFKLISNVIKDLMEVFAVKNSPNAQDKLSIKSQSSNVSNGWKLLRASLITKISEVSWKFEPLTPFMVKGSTKDISLDFNTLAGTFVGILFVSGIYFDLVNSTYGEEYLMKSKSLNNHFQIKNATLIDASWSFGELEVIIPTFLSVLHDILHSLRNSQEYIDKYKALFIKYDEHLRNLKLDLFSDSFDSNDKPDKPDARMDSKSLPKFRAHVDNKILRFQSIIVSSEIDFVAENIDFIAGNVIVDSEGKYESTILSSELSFPSMITNWRDKIIPEKFHKIFECSIFLKISDCLDSSQKILIELTSDYFRSAFNPWTATKILETIKASKVIFSKLAQDSSDKKKNTLVSQKAEKVLDSDPACLEHKKSMPASDYSQSMVFKIFSMFSIHILAYNSCLGWFFGSSGADLDDGFKLGCDKVYIISEETFGKFSIVQGYLTTSKNSSSDNFYTQVNNSYRATLPNMQMIYSLTKRNFGQRDLKIRVNGEALDIVMISNVVALCNSFMKSIALTQELKHKYVDTIILEEPQVTDEAETQNSNVNYLDIDTLSAGFASVNCTFSFAGGVVRLYKDAPTGACLHLHSPAMELAFGYNKDYQEKKHLARFSFIIFSSDNLLNSECVPIIWSMIDGVNSMMKNNASQGQERHDLMSSRTKRSHEVKNEKKEDISGTSSPLDFHKLLKSLDFDGVIHVQPQRFSLSCAPQAKIVAVVAMDGMKLKVNTLGKSEQNLLSISLLFNEFNIKLQHVYSKEVSGSVSVGKVLVTSVFQQEQKSLNSSTSGEISNISSFINVNQLQDLNIFKDIWYPGSVNLSGKFGPSVPAEIPIVKLSSVTEDEELDSPKVPVKTFAEKFQEVSSTNAFTWNASLIISDVSLVVDLGQSLGVASFQFDKFWITQLKNSQWESNLTLGIDTLSLNCEGRLSANFSIKDLRANSIIMWVHHEAVYEIPLVFVNFGIESFETVIGFDYHVFFVSKIANFVVSLFNQRQDSQNDKLFGTASINYFSVHSTCLAASNFMDIINSFLRIQAVTNFSYNEVLNENTSKYQDRGDIVQDKIEKLNFLETFTNLTTEVGVSINRIRIQIYPSSLREAGCLEVDSGRLSSKFSRNLYNEEFFSELKLQWNSLTVAFTKNKSMYEHKDITLDNLDEYIGHTLNSKGGLIFYMPLVLISMETRHTKNDNEIKYKFNSKFGGKVDIRWNLGLVNIIRAMYDSHEKAFSSRIAKNKAYKKFTHKDGASNFVEHKLGDDEENPESLETFKLTDKVQKAEEDTKFLYIPLEPPIIEPPQLKELGDVTPPLEWFGLHRKNFPSLTHHFIIMPLEQFLINVERQYNYVLGKA